MECERERVGGGGTVLKLTSRTALPLLSVLLLFVGTSSMAAEEERDSGRFAVSERFSVNEISFTARPRMKVGARHISTS